MFDESDERCYRIEERAKNMSVKKYKNKTSPPFTLLSYLAFSRAQILK